MEQTCALAASDEPPRFKFADEPLASLGSDYARLGMYPTVREESF